MLNNNFISCKAIIAKLYRDLKLKEEEAYMDFIEHISEALEFIHVYPQYDTKSACVKIKNYKGELPCDYIGIIAIDHGGYSLRYTDNLFGPRAMGRPSYPSDTPYSINRKKIENAVFVNPDSINYYPNRDSVQIKNGYINTSFKEDSINISYIALVLDEEGFPMIPDNVSFKEALYWYCTYKWLYPKTLQGEINAQFYNDAYSKWQYYCNQAGAEAMMPDLATLENIKRAFISLKPILNRADYFYSGLNK